MAVGLSPQSQPVLMLVCKSGFALYAVQKIQGQWSLWAMISAVRERQQSLLPAQSLVFWSLNAPDVAQLPHVLLIR